LDALPGYALEDSDDGDRRAVCDFICTVIAWLARRLRRHEGPPQEATALIPILDNEAIFGAYKSPNLAGPASLDAQRLLPEPDPRGARLDLVRPHPSGEPRRVAGAGTGAHPARTRIGLFDMAWWMHFRSVQPVLWPI
jgi:hypothetical protein